MAVSRSCSVEPAATVKVRFTALPSPRVPAMVTVSPAAIDNPWPPSVRFESNVLPVAAPPNASP
jgi:hypothetical protein